MPDNFGSRLRALRERSRLKQSELSALAQISTVTLSRYENGLTRPGAAELARLAAALETSVAYLIGESDTPGQPSSGVLDGVRVDALKSSGRIVRVPVLGPESAACCGNGFSCMEQVAAEAESYIDMPAGFLGPIDPGRLPFIIYADGDSMVDAGITDGAQVVINPADSVRDGDAALVDFALSPVAHNIAIKRVYWLDGGTVKIRSACGDGWERVFSAADGEEKSLRIIGKVEWIGHKPRRG